MEKLANIMFTMDDVKVRQLAIDIITSLCDAHNKGIIHGNINVHNILIDDTGKYILTGWDKKNEGLDNYQAPEVYFGKPCTISSDLYSLGLVLYLLRNENRLPFYPFDVDTISEQEREQALKSRMSGAVLPAPSHAEYDLSKIILKACAYREEERYQSAETFLNEFIVDIEIVDTPLKNAVRFPVKKVSVCAALVFAGGLLAWAIASHLNSNTNQGGNSTLNGDIHVGTNEETNEDSNTEVNAGTNEGGNTQGNTETAPNDKGYEEFYEDGGNILVRKYPDEDGGWLEIRQDQSSGNVDRIRFLADKSVAYQYPAEYDICEYQREMEYYQGSLHTSSSYERYYRDMGFEVWVSHEYADNTAEHYKYGILMSTNPDFEYEKTEYLVGIEYEYDKNKVVTGCDITFYYMDDNSVWQLTYDEAGRLDYVIHNIYDSEDNVTNSIIQWYSEAGNLVKIENNIGRKYRVVTQYNTDGSISQWHESFLNEKGNATKANNYIGIFERE